MVFAAIGSPGPVDALAGGTSGSVWNLAADFRVAPDQANPSPDSFGNAGVWQFLQSATLAHDPSGYSLLPNFITVLFGVDGLQAWQGTVGDGDLLPFVGVNARSDNPFPFGVDWPAGTSLVHPLPGQLVVVGWRSPISGKVKVSGGVTDAHAACGDGFDWSVDKGAVTLASGVVANGGAQSFSSTAGAASLDGIVVRTGDFLYFVVGPGPNGDHTCDSTRLDVTITRVETVQIDIQPGDTPNVINLSSGGLVSVAILHPRSSMRPVSRPAPFASEMPRLQASGIAPRPSGTGHLSDVNGDGKVELVLHYEVQETGIDPGDLRACLTGLISDGAIAEGCDAIRTISPGQWNLAADFRVAPDQANPSPDSFGNAGVWQFLQSATLAHDPSGYSLLPNFITVLFGVDGLQAWQGTVGDGDLLPFVGVNARSDNPFPFGVDWPTGHEFSSTRCPVSLLWLAGEARSQARSR